MDIEKKFNFLISDYGLIYKYQEFLNCYNGGWTVYTYSFYNKSGCFTIYSLPSRGELAFYYSKEVCDNLKDLCCKEIDVTSIEADIWEKAQKIGIFNNPFFWWSENKVLNTLAEVLKQHIAKHHEFFGVII